MIPAVSLLRTFFFVQINYLHQVLSYRFFFFMQSLPLYASCLFFMLLKNKIVEIEKTDGICSPTFTVDELLRLLLHPSIFSIKH